MSKYRQLVLFVLWKRNAQNLVKPSTNQGVSMANLWINNKLLLLKLIILEMKADN